MVIFLECVSNFGVQCFDCKVELWPLGRFEHGAKIGTETLLQLKELAERDIKLWMFVFRFSRRKACRSVMQAIGNRHAIAVVGAGLLGLGFERSSMSNLFYKEGEASCGPSGLGDFMDERKVFSLARTR